MVVGMVKPVKKMNALLGLVGMQTEVGMMWMGMNKSYLLGMTW